MRRAILEHLESRTLLTGAWHDLAEYQYSPGQYAGFTSMAEDANNQLYAAGNARDASGLYHGVVLKVDLATGASQLVDDLFIPGMSTGFNDITIDAAGRIFAVGLTQASTPGNYRWIAQRSTDAGQSWQTIDDFVYSPTRITEAHAVATDSAGNIYVGGLGYQVTVVHNQTTVTRHALIRKSIDGGSTWTTLDTASGPDANLTELMQTPSGLYAVGRLNDYWTVRRSTNQGASWTSLDQFRLSTKGTGIANGITTDPNGVLYVAGSSDGRWVVRKSTNGGSTWTTADNFQYPRTTTTYGSDAKHVVADAVGNVFVVGQGSTGTAQSHHFLLRGSSNGGSSWQTLDDVIPTAASGGLTDPDVLLDSAGRLFTCGSVPLADGTRGAVIRTQLTFGSATPTAAFSSSSPITSADRDVLALADELVFG